MIEVGASGCLLAGSAVKALETLRKQHPASLLVCGEMKEPRRWFEPALKEAKVSNFSWHCLRHTFASRLVMAGVDIRTVQEATWAQNDCDDGAIFPPCPKAYAWQPWSGWTPL
jgi:hypothetical protein